MPILLKRIEEDQNVKKKVKERRTRIIEKMVEFMGHCFTEQTGSKYSLMGPAGKLLNMIDTTKHIDWEKIKGYIINVMRNKQPVNPIAIELLEDVVNELKELRALVGDMKWLKIVSGIDYELYFQLYKTDTSQAHQKMNEKFQRFLENEFKSLDHLNDEWNTHFKNWKNIDLQYTSRENKKQYASVSKFFEKYKKEKKSKN